MNNSSPVGNLSEPFEAHRTDVAPKFLAQAGSDIAHVVLGNMLQVAAEQNMFAPKSAADHLSQGRTITGFTEEQGKTMSREAEVALGDILVALEVIEEELLKTKGDSFGEALVSGTPMPLFLRELRTKINKEEYSYVMDYVYPKIHAIERLHNQLLEEQRSNPGKHVRGPGRHLAD